MHVVAPVPMSLHAVVVMLLRLQHFPAPHLPQSYPHGLGPHKRVSHDDGPHALVSATSAAPSDAPSASASPSETAPSDFESPGASAPSAAPSRASSAEPSLSAAEPSEVVSADAPLSVAGGEVLSSELLHARNEPQSVMATIARQLEECMVARWPIAPTSAIKTGFTDRFENSHSRRAMLARITRA